MEFLASWGFGGTSVGFAAIALVVCATMAFALPVLTRRARRMRGRGCGAWMALIAVVAGLGAWATHLIAMLGFRPDLAIGFDPVRALGAGLAVVALIGAPVAASALVRGRRRLALLGALAGAGIGTMHVLGFSAREGISVAHGATATALSVAVGMAALAAAMPRLASPRHRTRVAALIVLGVAAPHFIAVARLDAGPLPDGAARVTDPALLAVFVAVTALVLIGAALIAAEGRERLEVRDRKAAAERRQQQRLLASVLETMSNGLVMIDPDGRIGVSNERARELLRLAPEDLAPGTPVVEFVRQVAVRNGWAEAIAGDWLDALAGWMALGSSVREDFPFRDGRIVTVACRPMPGGGAVLSYEDVSEVKRSEARMAHMAHHDSLTGLPNRQSFTEALQRLRTTGDLVGVLMIDLDRFKPVNDTLGHAIGDALLVAATARMREHVRSSDLIFRIGGDEFAVLPTPYEEESAEAIGRRLVAAFASPFLVDGHTVTIGCSIGLASATGDEDPELLVQRSDLALFRSKELGRGRLSRYEEGMVERAMERRHTEMDLIRAVGARQFVLHFQPLWALPERKLTGFEALIRWEHPVRGRISPAEFIPLAEENGLILEIGAWVLDEACHQAARWPAPLHVAVNVSPIQLRVPGFVEMVAETLDRRGLLASRLELELTETALVADGAQIAATLARLRELGVRIAMDDFGTGYSSLQHLCTYELDRIKIDRSFVAPGSGNAGATAVVRAVTGLARDLSILTVGEGVETEDQLDWLVSLGCDVAQGYLLGRPVDATAALRLIAGEDTAIVAFRRPTGT
jgi:diguanylate cyclase (GGDEF)-like protein